MATIANSWVEKQKKKKVAETAPAYEAIPESEISNRKPVKRFSLAARSTMVKTLRGIRK